jgi:hypothetical protein
MNKQHAGQSAYSYILAIHACLQDYSRKPAIERIRNLRNVPEQIANEYQFDTVHVL